MEEKQALLKVKFQQWKTKNEHDQTHLQEQLSTAEQARGEQVLFFLMKNQLIVLAES